MYIYTIYCVHKDISITAEYIVVSEDVLLLFVDLSARQELAIQQARDMMRPENAGDVDSERINLVLEALNAAPNERGVQDIIQKVRSFTQATNRTIATNDLVGTMKQAEIGAVNLAAITSALPKCDVSLPQIQSEMDRFLLVGVGDLMKKDPAQEFKFYLRSAIMPWCSLAL